MMFRVYFKKNEWIDVEALTSIEAMIKAGVTPETQGKLWGTINLGNETLPNDTFTIIQRGQKLRQSKLGELSLTLTEAFGVLAMPITGQCTPLVWLGDRWVSTSRLGGSIDLYVSKTFPYAYQAKR